MSELNTNPITDLNRYNLSMSKSLIDKIFFMDKIILKDKTAYELLDGAYVGNIQIKANGMTIVNEISEKFNSDNLSEVTITTNDVVSGKYTDLVSESFSYAKTEDETAYIVTISLREKTDIEKRLDSLEKGHIANATAIDSIITDIIPGMEDTEGAE